MDSSGFRIAAGSHAFGNSHTEAYSSRTNAGSSTDIVNCPNDIFGIGITFPAANFNDGTDNASSKVTLRLSLKRSLRQFCDRQGYRNLPRCI